MHDPRAAAILNESRAVCMVLLGEGPSLVPTMQALRSWPGLHDQSGGFCSVPAESLVMFCCHLQVDTVDGIREFDGILESADGIMLCRLQLGLAIPPEKVCY